MSVFWLIMFILLIIVELMSANLVTLWFALGAVVAMISTFITDNVLIQLTVFIVVSFISLYVTKPLVKKFKVNEKTPTNLDRVIGKKAEVTKKITSDEYGEVKVYGNYWTASSDQTFDVGDKVIIKNIDGVKLIVDKEEEK